MHAPRLNAASVSSPRDGMSSGMYDHVIRLANANMQANVNRQFATLMTCKTRSRIEAIASTNGSERLVGGVCMDPGIAWISLRGESSDGEYMPLV